MKENLQTEFLTRQYMISQDFEIYYYHDTVLPPPVNLHRHDYYELYFFLDGNVQMQIEDQSYSLKPGSFILIPPGVSHKCVIENMQIPYNRFVLWISQECFLRLEKTSPDYVFMLQYVKDNHTYIFQNDKITFNAIQSRIFRLIEEQRSTQFGHITQCTLCLKDLLLFLNRLVYNQQKPNPQALPVSLHENMIDYIKNHLEDNLSLEKLSQEFFVSKFHISHIFKEFYGVSIYRYITQKRLQACKEAIESGGRISELCHQFGFGDYSCFYRAFKKEYGISPKECQDMVFLEEKNIGPSKQ